MANYYGDIRSNYFKVKDVVVAKFTKELQKLVDRKVALVLKKK
jgi:hypothetical protein